MPIRPLILLLILLAQWAHAETYIGHVVGIADGDTITVLDAANVRHKVRLAGIDAPEKKQPWGTRAREHLAQLIFDKSVTVETKKHDRYRREICKVLLGDQDAGLAQIEAGLAWHYKAFEREQSVADRQRYAIAEATAKNGLKRLWGDRESVAPWEWRNANKTIKSVEGK